MYLLNNVLWLHKFWQISNNYRQFLGSYFKIALKISEVPWELIKQWNIKGNRTVEKKNNKLAPKKLKNWIDIITVYATTW